MPLVNPAPKTLATLRDDELVVLARRGDRAARDRLLSRYAGVVRRLARSHFGVGGDREDVLASGMEGLRQSISLYDPRSAKPFRAFAECWMARVIRRSVERLSRPRTWATGVDDLPEAV